MWVAVIGAVKTGKGKIASLIAEKLDGDFVRVERDMSLFNKLQKSSQYAFDYQLKLMSQQFQLDYLSYNRGRNSGIVTTSLFQETMIYNKLLNDIEFLDNNQFESLRFLSSKCSVALRPPSMIVYLKLNIMASRVYGQLRGDESFYLEDERIKRLNELYEEWIPKIKVPLIEETVEENFELTWSRISLGIDSIISTNLVDTTIWNKTLE